MPSSTPAVDEAPDATPHEARGATADEARADEARADERSAATPDDPGDERVTVAVLTYRRPADLAALLPMLVAQTAAVGPRRDVLVVDNDPDASAAATVAAAGPGVRYVHEPRPGIAAARNRALAEAGDAELLVFVDDDERPCDGWLDLLLATYRRERPAAVVGPVVSAFAVEPTPWVAAGRFFDRRRLPTGTPVTIAATNNLLLDLAQVRALGLEFDERFGLSGGSDMLLTRQLTARGGRMVWCDEAVVTDVVPPQRVTRRWVLQRAFRSGNTWARTSVVLAGGPGARAVVRARVAAQGAVRVAGGAARWLTGALGAGQGARARGVRTVARGAGMLAGVVGVVHVEYRRPSVQGRRSPLRRVAGVARLLLRDPAAARERVVLHALTTLLERRNRTSRTPVTGDAPVVVSLTTYGARTASVHLSVESIARGTVRPARMILWIDDAEVVDDPPPPLRRLRARGLEIRHCPDYGPHKKQYPYVSSPDGYTLPLVTADDDMLFPAPWLEQLVAAHRATPDVVVGLRAHTVTLDGDRLAPYTAWTAREGTAASFRAFCTGGAGAVLPLALLDALAAEGTAFLDAAPRADDVWVHAVAVRHGIRARQVGEHQVHPRIIRGTQVGTLQRTNVREGGNDRQIAAAYRPEDVARIVGDAG